MAEVKVRACDICGRHEGIPGIVVEKITIDTKGERVRGEVCQEHLAPAEELVAALKKARGGGRPRHDFESLMVDDPSQIPLKDNG